MNMKRFLRFLKCNYRRREHSHAICYSANGFLVDVLEQNGFAVDSIECYGPDNTQYRLNIRLGISRESFTKLVASHAKSILKIKYGCDCLTKITDNFKF